jgi:hypothetical protein
MAPGTAHPYHANNLRVYTRGGGKELEPPYEKPVIVPAAGNEDPATHAWTDARFATDIMAEHALFFVLLMPPEVAGDERADALRFYQTFTALNQRVDAGGPPRVG